MYRLVVSWNGLMINALAQAAVSLPEDRYPVAGRCREMADDAIDFIRETMYDSSTGGLVRSWREGKGTTVQADDYAFSIQALIRMFSTTGQASHLVKAIEVQDKMDERFEDKQGGRHWTSEEDELVLVRMKESQNGAERAASSAAVHNVFASADYCSDRYQAYRDKVVRTLTFDETKLKRASFVLAIAIAGGCDVVKGMREYVIVRQAGSTFTRSIIKAIHATGYIPTKVVIYIDASYSPRRLAAYSSVVKDNIDGIERDRATGNGVRESLRIYRDFACGLPIFVLAEARKKILG